MKISVVIATYKRPQLMARCLQSLRRQDFDAEAYEIIVVSDGPDAATEEVCKAENANEAVRLQYFSLPRKKGPAAARNLGWRQAGSALIVFTDDDCIASPAWLKDIWKNYAGEALIAFSGQLSVPLERVPTDYEKNASRLEAASFITANCGSTRAALEQVQGFDERFGLAWREDSDLEFKLLEARIPVIKIDGALVVHPVREAGWGVSIREQKKCLYNALLYKKFPALYREKIGSAPLWNYYMMIIFFLLFLVSVYSGRRTAALLFFSAWSCLVARFTAKRLKGTSRSWRHVLEMMVTSMVIPFLSVYWTLYGAKKFRVLFL